MGVAGMLQGMGGVAERLKAGDKFDVVTAAVAAKRTDVGGVSGECPRPRSG
jgi:hypothetical protein